MALGVDLQPAGRMEDWEIGRMAKPSVFKVPVSQK
jgi:hypothetical protein